MIMKKLLLLLFFANCTLAQQADVEIRLVNQDIGAPVYFNLSQANSSNDAGLNTILQNYGVVSYLNKYGHPYEPYISRTISIYGAYSQQFITDLRAYSSVIASVQISDSSYFYDALRLKLNNINVGSPTGFNGTVVETNDPTLNQIFQTFDVFYYDQLIPSSSNPELLKYYAVTCNCDASLLRIALDNHDTTIDFTERSSAGYLLDNRYFEKPKAIISPNPFTGNFYIETEQTITKYSINDITGKTTVSTSSKSDLDSQSAQLSVGIYILTLDFDNGQKANYKLVKK